MARPWRAGKALLKLRDQFNVQFPNRKKGADGTVGDAAHQSRSSDHNPHIVDGSYGVVSAIDITHDPAGGVDVHAIFRALAAKKDPRIKYLISNRQICSSTSSPWVWRKYTGSNPHTSHAHLSVKATKSHYDNEAAWNLFGATPPTPPPPSEQRPTLRKGSKGEFVKRAQSALGIAADGDFGPATERATKAFQTEHKLTSDGVIGPATWAALDKAVWEKPDSIDPDSPALREILHRGSHGDEVKTVQKLLALKPDGDFGAITEAAVKAFQVGMALNPSGVVDAQTWEELDDIEQSPIDVDMQNDIIATVFGGAADPNQSAYENRMIDDEEFGVALPHRFPVDERPQIDVINRANGRRVTCDVVDVGPWVIDDPYWQHKARPLAETIFKNNQTLPRGPHRGKRGNGGGIDLTPGAAREIGLVGKGRVDWAFAEEKDEGES